MMPVNFEGSNLVLTKPEGWKDEDCLDLHAMKGVDAEGNPFILTHWMPSKEDLEAMNAGRGLWVRTVSHSFAPMSIVTLDDNNNVN